MSNYLDHFEFTSHTCLYVFGFWLLWNISTASSDSCTEDGEAVCYFHITERRSAMEFGSAAHLKQMWHLDWWSNIQMYSLNDKSFIVICLAVSPYISKQKWCIIDFLKVFSTGVSIFWYLIVVLTRLGERRDWKWKSSPALAICSSQRQLASCASWRSCGSELSW